jgi:1-aminocyclopropane-1-carboxylate deaminase
MIHDDHFGGYAKKSRILFDFMNLVYSESGIPTDFVYTGKLFYSTVRLATENFFPSGSRILVLHTGGLQGNLSLPAGLLHF